MMRATLEDQHGQVWDIEQLKKEFTVVSFSAPFVVVIRKKDQRLGTLQFQHEPRYYFDFVAS